MVMFHAAMLFVLALGSGEPCDSDFFLHSWELLRDARWGTGRFEQAAFAVVDNDHRIRFIRWRVRGTETRAHYVGPVPPNAIAIVHTHPNRLPEPSRDDGAVAKRLGMPVYVVTRLSISFTTGGETQVAALGDWNPELCK
jgi:hypothetical protein